MAEQSIELKVERTPLGNLKVELPPLKLQSGVEYKRAVYRLVTDQPGVMRMMKIPPDLDTGIDTGMNHNLIGLDFICTKGEPHSPNCWWAHNTTNDHKRAYRPQWNDIEYRALEMLLEASRQQTDIVPTTPKENK